MIRNLLVIIGTLATLAAVVALMMFTYHPDSKADDCEKNPGKTYCTVHSFTSEKSTPNDSDEDTECSDSATQADAHFCIKKRLEVEKEQELEEGQ